MMTHLLLLPLLLFVLTAHADATVHRIDVVHQRVPGDVYRRIRGPPQITHLLRQRADAMSPRLRRAQDELYTLINGHRLAAPANALTTSLPLNIAQYGDVTFGNITLGSPPQNFSLDFNIGTPNLYVIGLNASYYEYCHYYECDYGSDDPTYTPIDDKRLYNASASSSYSALNANFSTNIFSLYLNGSVASDALQVGGLSAGNVSFEVASVVDPIYDQLAIDGTFGLCTEADANASTTLLGQLQSQLDSPVFTYHTDLPYGESTGSGQITLGSLAPDMCESNWTVVAQMPQMTLPPGWECFMPMAVVVNVTTRAPGDSGTGCEYFVDVPMYVDVFAAFDPDVISGGIQFLELFVQASGAEYNMEKQRYELSHAEKKHAQPVYFHLDGGGVFQVDPEDYVVEKDGVLVLNVEDVGAYDLREAPFVSLNRNFVNHHCFSKNIPIGEWSIASVLK